MSKKNNLATRARQHEFDLKREKEQLDKQAKRIPNQNKMKIDSVKIKKKVSKKKKKKSVVKAAGAAKAMEIDS